MTGAFLIADDSESKTAMLRAFLTHAHWQGDILIADTSEEAMRLIDENDVAFGFIDYYIPSMNGPAIIAYIKKKNPAARVALVSSSDKKSNFDEATKAGADICICTSYQSDEMESAMMELIREWKKY